MPTASAYDSALVEAGGRLFNVTVGDGGSVDVYGELRGATVEAGGTLTLEDGGSVVYEPVTVEKGGEVVVNGGLVENSATFHVAGKLTLNAALQSYEEYYGWYSSSHGFRFVLDEFEAPNTEVLINDYELLKTCNASFSVSVSSEIEAGDYLLMGNAANYSNSVTVYTGSRTDYLWLGGESEIGDKKYSLSVEDDVLTLTVENCLGSDVPALTQTWDLPSDSGSYVVEYSTDDFEHVVRMVVNDTALDSFAAPAGCQWRVRAEESDEWSEPDAIYAASDDDGPRFIKSNSDGVDDVFFARATGAVWSSGYQAKHVGSLDSEWNGTG